MKRHGLVLVLGLAVLAAAGTMGTVHAQISFSEGSIRFSPIELEAVVTSVIREHGIYADQMTFTVKVTNTGDSTTTIDVVDLWDDSEYGVISDTCLGTINIPPGETRRLKPCFVIHLTAAPTALTFNDVPVYDYGFGITIKQHVLPFRGDMCGDEYTANNSCQAVQRINHLIRDIEPEPLMCEAPMTTTTQPADEPADEADTQSPQLMAAAYHKIFGELVLSFDENITLADDWQGNITIGGVLVGERASNRMVGESSLVWISVDYTVKKELQDAHSQMVTIEAGTFLDADGNHNDRIIVQTVITG